jgi:UDP:flavonoid glycosyltransferase YjiC (YdhE family)
MEDLLISQFNSQIESDASNGVDYFKRFDLLESFFNKNQGRRVIYATFGTIAKAGSEVIECLKYLLKRDMAIVSNIYLEGLSEKDRSLYFFARYLPMHFVCSKSDLVIHHCGSGSYHYPIINHAPSITIGTQCYDRDDVAVRLEELGVSMHLPAPAEHGDFVRSFVEKVEQYFANSGALLNEKKKNLIPLREEIERTIETFDFEGALKQAISSYKSLQPGARRTLKYASVS